MLAPMNIRDAESTPVKRMPILSRMMPARIRNPKTLKMNSELPYMPKTSGVHAALGLDHALQRRHHVYEHVAEEHRQRDQNQRRPADECRIVEFSLDNFRHSYLI